MANDRICSYLRDVSEIYYELFFVAPFLLGFCISLSIFMQYAVSAFGTHSFFFQKNKHEVKH